MTTTTLDDIRALLEKLGTDTAADKAEDSSLARVLNEVSSALADIVDLLEKPDTDAADAKAASMAIVEALRGLQIKPPDVQVTVTPAAPQVVISPAPMAQAQDNPRGWVLSVYQRDEFGRPQTYHFKPE